MSHFHGTLATSSDDKSSGMVHTLTAPDKLVEEAQAFASRWDGTPFHKRVDPDHFQFFEFCSNFIANQAAIQLTRNSVKSVVLKPVCLSESIEKGMLVVAIDIPQTRWDCTNGFALSGIRKEDPCPLRLASARLEVQLGTEVVCLDLTEVADSIFTLNDLKAFLSSHFYHPLIVSLKPAPEFRELIKSLGDKILSDFHVVEVFSMCAGVRFTCTKPSFRCEQPHLMPKPSCAGCGGSI